MTFQSRDYQALFRLLGDPSLYQKYQIPPLASAPTPTLHAFSLNFGVFETPKEYVIEGELPGLSDKSKVVIEFVDAQTFLVYDKVERPFHTNEKAGGKSLKPTVEDEEEVAKRGQAGAPSRKENAIKYWASERTLGEFQRNFTFPSAIDLDGVKAGLGYGVLGIIVPKKVQVWSRKIEIHWSHVYVII